jgi:serine/threonine protein phosphatase PrpC
MKNKIQKKIPKNYYRTYPQITYSSIEYQNKSHNENMEDIIFIDPEFNGGHHKGLFTLYDGHGGNKSAKISSEKFPKIFLKNLNEIKPKNIEKSLINSYKIIDSQLKNENCFKEGNTATIIYIEYNNIYCVIISKDKIEKINYDDKINDKIERKRILKLGKNNIYDDRLEGILSLSRALGDFNLKDSGLISLPHFKKYSLNYNVKYCIIASDGIWDFVSKDYLFEISKKNYLPNELCKIIVNEAIKNGSEDNISCIVIGFNWKY